MPGNGRKLLATRVARRGSLVDGSTLPRACTTAGDFCAGLLDCLLDDFVVGALAGARAVATTTGL